MPAFWPWRHVLGELPRRRPGLSARWPAANRLRLGTQGDGAARVDPDQARAELFEEVAAFLASDAAYAQRAAPGLRLTTG